MILSSCYTLLTRLSAPLLVGVMHLRTARGKEDKTRLPERMGVASLPRPDRQLVWIHAASNGEALSALAVIDYLRQMDSSPAILMTTMTVTAAKLMETRLPKDGFCFHQFVPYDNPAWIEKFHTYWRPDVVLWVESELWPNHLRHIQNHNIPAALLNARLSDRSVKRWHMAASWFRSIMSAFSLYTAQTERDQKNLQSLGLNNVLCVGNLKDIASPLPYDDYALDDMLACVGNRPTVLFASTHEGEEDIAARTYLRLKATFPNLLTIIVPRHPKRAEDIINTVQKHGLKTACRSVKMSPRTDTDIYIADTLGELGLFYRLCEVVFVGNSLHVKPGGGHNLLEPALLGCAIISGDDLHNFSVQAQEMPQNDACIIIHNEDELVSQMTALLNNPEQRMILAANALRYATEKRQNGLENILNSCESIFKKARLI